MDERQQPADLERAGWTALSAGAEEATRFYDEVLDAVVVMLLPEASP